jgi:hypothetical protein
MNVTKKQFEVVTGICRDIFTRKLNDYGASWRILRPTSVTDQIFIKANRIRTLEFIGIVNYGIIGLIQLELNYADTVDISNEKAIELYDKFLEDTKQLMYAKNHDYDEAWRSMRVSSYTDLILMKIYRTKEIEANDGQTLISEGIDANYMDMINYAIFGLIKLHFSEENISEYEKV